MFFGKVVKEKLDMFHLEAIFLMLNLMSHQGQVKI